MSKPAILPIAILAFLATGCGNTIKPVDLKQIAQTRTNICPESNPGCKTKTRVSVSMSVPKGWKTYRTVPQGHSQFIPDLIISPRLEDGCYFSAYIYLMPRLKKDGYGAADINSLESKSKNNLFQLYEIPEGSKALLQTSIENKESSPALGTAVIARATGTTKINQGYPDWRLIVDEVDESFVRGLQRSNTSNARFNCPAAKANRIIKQTKAMLPWIQVNQEG